MGVCGMRPVFEQWKTTMETCGLAVGSTDETVVRELREALGLDEELAGWYRECAPRMGELDFGGNPVQLYGPEELMDLQMNFSHDLQNMKRDPEWKIDWIVIADKGLDPLIYDMKSKGVYYARHGQRDITLKRLSPDLKGWIKALVVLCEICYLTYHGRFVDENGEISPKILQEMKEKLNAFLPGECIGNWWSLLE
jgi:hypothetical protein